mmetsp:Transcript_44278/g.93035  ORF Transcript_44278/g.93035 Transcript_44278/m.93035 type:complete len:222 (-) Transcript_44278:273-938(-)
MSVVKARSSTFLSFIIIAHDLISFSQRHHRCRLQQSHRLERRTRKYGIFQRRHLLLVFDTRRIERRCEERTDDFIRPGLATRFSWRYMPRTMDRIIILILHHHHHAIVAIARQMERRASVPIDHGARSRIGTPQESNHHGIRTASRGDVEGRPAHGILGAKRVPSTGRYHLQHLRHDGEGSVAFQYGVEQGLPGLVTFGHFGQVFPYHLKDHAVGQGDFLE